MSRALPIAHVLWPSVQGIPPRLLSLTLGKADKPSSKVLKKEAPIAISSPAASSPMKKKRRPESELGHIAACMKEDLELHADLQRQRNGSSGSSEHATDTAFLMSSCSPDQQNGTPVDVDELPSGTGRETAHDASKGDPPAAKRIAVSVSCQAGSGMLLPPSCISSTGFSSAAASMRSISPFDLLTPQAGSSQRPPKQLVDDAFINGLIDRAKSIKYAVDREQQGKRWSVRALCKYLESALVYMEACEHSHQSPGKSVRRTAWWVGELGVLM